MTPENFLLKLHVHGYKTHTQRPKCWSCIYCSAAIQRSGAIVLKCSILDIETTREAVCDNWGIK